MRPYTFGNASASHIAECHPQLQAVILRALRFSYIDFAVICGHRNEQDQNEAVNSGASKLWWPDGEHNKLPSRAADLSPSPQDWSDEPKALARFYLVAGAMFAAANDIVVSIRWGGDWDRDRSLVDQTFDDLGHFELIDIKPLKTLET